MKTTDVYADGHLNARNAAIQRPTLLNRYAVRPPWMVAGVDYGVGYASGTVLTDWQNLTGPGIAVVGNLVRVDNTSGAHIDGVDFSLHGGANLAFINSPGGIVTNSNFQSTTTAGIIQADSASPGLTVMYCVIAGGADGSSLISAIGGGDITIQYNWLHDFPQHVLEIDTSTALDYRFNLIENGGTVGGAHLNYLQLQGRGVVDSALVEFNTTYQARQAAGGEGFQFELNDSSGNSGTLVSPTFAYNTMIAAGSLSMSYMLHGSSTYSGSNPYVTPIRGNASIHDNYFDARGAYGVFYPGSFAGWNVYNNLNMVNGEAIRAPSSRRPR